MTDESLSNGKKGYRLLLNEATSMSPSPSTPQEPESYREAKEKNWDDPIFYINDDERRLLGLSGE
jgi:hypothetical protein